MTTPRPRLRWSLRSQLITLVVATSAVVLLAVAIVVPILVRSELINDRDRMLEGVVSDLPGSISIESLRAQSSDSPLQGSVGWSVVSPSGIASVIVTPARYPAANPDVGPRPEVGTTETVSDVHRASVTYRILAVPVSTVTGATAYLVAWSPLTDIQDTISRLILGEILVLAALLLVVGLTSGLMIQRSLRPLRQMAQAADDIAAGDLDRRVNTRAAPGTEVGRLGTAFNGMLDGISTLVDERTRAEERLRRFISDASHELRTPVAAVKGYSDLYRAGALADPASVDRAMERMGSLVEDLLTLVQADVPDRIARERVDLNALLDGVVEDAEAIDPTRTWHLNLPPGKVTVTGDPMRLHQLFANLLGNVRTHTPAGTTAEVAVLPGPGRVAVTVSDDGPGVSDEDLNRIFDRFFRADPSRSRAHGGTGLGLSIVWALAKAHGGEVLASRSPAGGLAVTVVLPLASGTSAVDGREEFTRTEPAAAVLQPGEHPVPR